MATFVLVPGAWLGAWVWEDTVRALRERGHTAIPVSLTGVGERVAEATRETGLDTHVRDIVTQVEEADLTGVTLVGHSYAAAPVTGAAPLLGSRLERVVYVDSAPLSDGMALFDLMDEQETEAIWTTVREQGDGWLFAMPSFEDLGGELNAAGLGPEQRATLRERATTQPVRTYQQPLSVPGPLGPGVDRVLLACNEFTGLLDADLPPLAFAKEPPWRRFDLATGHWPMLSAPVELAETLHRVVSD